MIKVDGKKITNTTIFGLPIFGLPKQHWDEAGLFNAYIGDQQVEHKQPAIYFALWTQEKYADLQDDLITMMDSIVLDTYGYNEVMRVIVLAIPEEFVEDYQKMIEGKYSELSTSYKELVSDKVSGGNPVYEEKDGRRLQMLVIDCDPIVRTFVEKEYDISTEQCKEVWEAFDIKQETITPQVIQEITFLANNKNLNYGDCL